MYLYLIFCGGCSLFFLQVYNLTGLLLLAGYGIDSRRRPRKYVEVGDDLHLKVKLKI